MSAAQPSLKPSGNRLLSLLPQAEYAHLQPELQPIHLAKEMVLYNAGDEVQNCYFPTSGMVALLSTTESGKTIEVSMIGDEGFAGVPVILQTSKIPYRVVVQIAGDAVMIRASTLKKHFNQGGRLHDLLLRYTHSLLCQVSQSAACNKFHTVEQRLCRWLLISRDRVHSDTFPLTQEFIAHMLGVPRTNVTMTAGALQRAGLIKYTRGQITIINPQGLEETACECYRIVKEQTDTL